MLKVFAFSTLARPRVSQCCAAHLISGNGCSGNEGRPKTPSHRPHASSSQFEPKAAGRQRGRRKQLKPERPTAQPSTSERFLEHVKIFLSDGDSVVPDQDSIKSSIA